MTDKGLIANASTTIDATMARVWDALTTPEIIKQYMFGTEVVSDWKEGSPIAWKGIWEGKPYQDKGKILKMVPGRTLQMTHFSPLSGAPDSPENYHTLTYELSEKDGQTEVTLSQDKNANDEERAHSQQMWESLLKGLKKVLEGEK